MFRITLALMLLILSACNAIPIEEPTAPPDDWAKARASLNDFATVLAVVDESDDVAFYIALVEEFATCMGSVPNEEQEDIYEDLSPSEMVALTIWTSGLFGAFSVFDFEVAEGEEESAHSFLAGAIEVCNQIEEE